LQKKKFKVQKVGQKLPTRRAQCKRLREGKLTRMPVCSQTVSSGFSTFSVLWAHGSSRYARTISQHADGISWYSVPASAGQLLPLEITKSTTDKPWVMPGFQEFVKERQRALLKGDLTQYHYLRNHIQHMAAKLCKNYFTAKVKQLYSRDPHQWWT